MSLLESHLAEILNNIILNIYRYGTPVIYLLGNLGNLLSVSIFLKRTWRKNVCVFYFIICVFLNFAYINSTILATIFINGFNINIQNSNSILCKFFFYTSFVFSFLLPNILILASIDRLLISSQNVETRLYSSKRLAYFMISISTLFWFLFNIHVLIKVDLQEFAPSYFVCYYDPSKFYNNFVSYSSLCLTVLNDFLMIILTIFSFKNVRQIKILPRQQIRRMTKKDFQLLRCLFAQDIVYIILSTFMNINDIYSTIKSYREQTLFEQIINDFLTKFFNWLYFLLYLSNFFIFISISKAFRQELKRKIWKLFGKQILPLREVENNIEQIPRLDLF